MPLAAVPEDTRREPRRRNGVGESEQELWLRYQRTRATECRNTLIETYIPMVRRLARRILWAGRPRTVELDDLISMGTLGLIEAMDRFDVRRGVPFPTFCLRRVQGSILDGLRGQDWIPRGVRELGVSLERLGTDLRARLGRRPTVFEMAAELGVGPAKFLHMERRCRAAVVEHDLRAVENAPSREVPPPDAVHWRQVRDVAMRILDPRERRVLTLYYFEGMRLKDIAVRLGVTQSRVAQIHSEIIAKLRGKLWGSRLDLFCA